MVLGCVIPPFLSQIISVSYSSVTYLVEVRLYERERRRSPRAPIDHDILVAISPSGRPLVKAREFFSLKKRGKDDTDSRVGSHAIACDRSARTGYNIFFWHMRKGSLFLYYSSRARDSSFHTIAQAQGIILSILYLMRKGSLIPY